MLYLNPNTPRFIKAKKAFHKGMRAFVLERIGWMAARAGVNGTVAKWLFDNYIMDYIDDILIGEPFRLIEISDYIKPFIDSIPDFKKAVEYVFNYKTFTTHANSRYDAYQLAHLLDVRTCTYCNRNYTNTVIKDNGKKLTRPQFDHYFDKARHPVLAISFFNLIPSCSICNSSIKGTHKMSLADYTHPYIDNTLEHFRFSYRYSNKSKNGLQIKIKAPDPSKAKNTIDAFAIEEVYNSHTGELLDLLRTKQYFSDKYLSILKANLLRDVIVSKEDLYRIVFGTEYDETNFVNRPFSKFKSDILKELGII